MNSIWREVFISQMGDEILFAVVENEQLVEFRTLPVEDETLLGNIYKGRIKRVLEGMDAAFVDLGEDVDGFLYVSDLRSNWERWLHPQPQLAHSGRSHRTGFRYRITEHISEHQDIIVQVKREAIDHKAPRVSTKIALTGTYLVYTPTGYHIGVSSRITDPDRRAYLKRLGRGWVGSEGGIIFRTASADIPDEILEQEWYELRSLWDLILRRAHAASGPRLIYREPATVYRHLRDLLGPSLRRIYVDNPRLFQKLRDQLKEHYPEWIDRMELYQDAKPLMYSYGIHKEIHRLLRNKVWLRSGAYLVINQTEALVTIDVNTGKNIGTRNFQDSVLEVNLEAVKEIVRQIRLRNLSGLILIDFIDMEPVENWWKLRQALENELKRDRTRTCILPQSGKSLVLLTRQKMQASLLQQLTTHCPHCRGKGFQRSPRMIAWDIIWKLSQIQGGIFTKATVRAHPEVIDLLRGLYRGRLRSICRQMEAEIELREDRRLNMENYDLTFS